MGALHKGHQALIKRARTLDKDVIVSIFVNPLQFENKSDLEQYPRSPERDIEIATIAGATEVWFPEYEDLYPEGFTTLSAGTLGNVFEGASRPGHFDGVVTVIDRLYAIAKPDKAVFGEKDFQQ
jgi:pantoate--beta-alanine ligase